MEVYGSRINVRTTDELSYRPQPPFLKDSQRANSTLSQISGISYTDSSSGELVRILLAPYMSPFIVSLKKVKNWESLISLLQRMFGESFCSLEEPPHITNQRNGTVIGQSDWAKSLKPDLTIVVHTSKKNKNIPINNNNNNTKNSKSSKMMMHKKSTSAPKGHSKSPSCELLSTGGSVVAIGVEPSPTKQKVVKRERSLQNLLTSKRMYKHGKSASEGLPEQPVLPGPPVAGQSEFRQHHERPPLKSVFESYSEKDGKQKTKMGKKLWGAMVSVFKDHSDHDNSTNVTVSKNSNAHKVDNRQEATPEGESQRGNGNDVASLERARPKKQRKDRSKRNSKILSPTSTKRNSRGVDPSKARPVSIGSLKKERKNKDLLRMARKKRRSRQQQLPVERVEVSPRRASLELETQTITPAPTRPSTAHGSIVHKETSFSSINLHAAAKNLPPTPVSPFSPPPSRAPPPPPPQFAAPESHHQAPPSPPLSPKLEPTTVLSDTLEEEPLDSLASEFPLSPAPLDIPVDKKPPHHRRTLSKGSITSIRPRLSLRTSANSLKELASRHLRSNSKSGGSATSPPIPTRPRESTGLNAQYECLDEEVIRKTVDEIMNGIKKAVDADDEVAVTTPTTPSSATAEKKSRKSSKTGGSPRRKRRGTTSSSGGEHTRPDSRSSRRTTRSRAESMSTNGNKRHSNMPHDAKPLPKLPYKFSPFPAPTPSTPTFYPTSPQPPMPSNVSIKNGHLPPIAPFEELVRNTRSYSDADRRPGSSRGSARKGSISSASGRTVTLQRHESNASATTAVTAMTGSER